MANRTAHVPLRRCVLCRTAYPKAALVRLVRDGEGRYELDLAGRAGGRGTWVCRGCAADPAEKRLRQAFRGHAPRVRALLAGLGLPADDLGRDDAHTMTQDGGMHAR